MIARQPLCPDLRFEEESHRYFLGERELPSVTTILRDEGLIDTSRFTEHHRDLGTLRHLVCELDDLGDLDESTVAPELAPALAAWRKFRAEAGFEPTHVEVGVHSALGFAGTVDRVGILRDGRRVIVDIKGSSVLPSHRIQLWAYWRAWQERTGEALAERLSVHLAPNGTYRVVTHGDSRDLATALAVVAVHNWKRANLRA